MPVAFALPDIVAALLAKVELTPDGKPEVEADKLPAQIGVAVYTIGVIAVVADTVCELEPLVSAMVNSLPQTGLLASVKAELVAKFSGSEVILVTHQPVKF